MRCVATGALILLVLPLASVALAICSDFSLGIANVERLGSFNQWRVFDNDCNNIDSVLTNENPCVTGVFGCSPAPILFQTYKNLRTSQQFRCVGDPTPESCGGGPPISVCCSPS